MKEKDTQEETSSRKYFVGGKPVEEAGILLENEVLTSETLNGMSEEERDNLLTFIVQTHSPVTFTIEEPIQQL